MASNELDIADDIEASEYFNLAVLNNGVTLKVSDALEPTEPPPRRNLFAISNLFGLAVVGTNNGFAIFTLSALRRAYTSAKQRTQATAEPLRTVSIGDGGLWFVKIGLADKVVIASGPALQGGIGVWRLKSLVDGTSTSPLHVFPPTSSAPLLDVLPNPGDRPELLAILSQDGQIVMINMESKATVTTFGQGITAACWSVKGKQIVTGDQNGNLTQYTPEGEPKTVTEAPPSLRGRGMKVLDIRWVENAVFFVTYCDAENPMDTSIFVSTRAKDGSVTYSPILDPLMVESMDRPEARFNAWMKNWTPFKHLLLVCNATSNTIGHVGLGPVGESGSNVAWSSIKNDLYTTLPLETYSLGLDIDFTDTAIPLGEEHAGGKPLPALWSYASDGSLSAWRIVNLQGEQYPAIAAPYDIETREEAGMPTTTTTGVAESAAIAPAISSASPFGNSGGASSTAFGSTAFGSGTFSSPPSFGRAPSFGAPPSFAPAFGQAAFGSAPAFGKPAFGQPAAPTAVTPVKGGFSAFSAQPSAFASSSASSTTSPFASISTSPAATPAFDSAQQATFGSSAFGQPGAASGSASMATSPAPSAFGQSSPFGTATSTTSPFGNAKPASGGLGTFAATQPDKPASSGFGAFSASTNATSSGFAFGKAPAESSKNAFGLANPSAFGSLREDATTPSAPVMKPPGLNEDDAEDMEPVNTATQQGGALDFDDDGNTSDSGRPAANALSFGGLGFGSSKAQPEAHAAPAAFGNFAKPTAVAATSSTTPSTPSPFALKPKDDAIPAKSTAFGSSAFGHPASGKLQEESKSQSPDASSSGKSPFSFAKAAEGKEESNASASKPTTSPFATFGSTSSTSEEAKGSTSNPSPFGGFGKPTPLGQTKFGQPSAFGQISGSSQPSASGQSPAFGASQEKPVFSFAKPTTDAKGTGGFASFASASGSSSKSPFAFSPVQSPAVTPAFGQPGLFKNLGQQTLGSPETPAPRPKQEEREIAQDTNSNESADILELSPQQPESSHEKSSEGQERDEESVKDEALSQEEGQDEWDEEGQEGEDYGEDNDEGDDEDEREEGDEEDREVVPEGSDNTEEDEALYNDSLAEETQEDAAHDAEEDNPSPASVSQSTGTESEGSPSPPGSPSPAPTVAQTLDTTDPAKPRSSFAPQQSAFSFASTSAKSSEPGKSAAPSWSASAKQTDQDTPKAISNPFAGFGKSPSPVTGDFKLSGESKTEAPKSASGVFGQSSSSGPVPLAGPSKQAPSRQSESPKPFGLGNLQKATPRTSSPLASMPAFAPPASPSQTQSSSFDLSNLSSAPSSPVTSPTKATQLLPPSTTPLGKPPAPVSFSQPATAPGQPLEAQQSENTPRVSKKSASTSSQVSTISGNTLAAPPKLSSSIPKEREGPDVNPDTLNIFLTMQDHIDALKESAAACMSFFHSVQPARLPKEALARPTDVLAYDVQWGMGDIPRLREATRSLSKTLAEVSQQARDEEKAARSLEGSLLKTKAKAEEINRYLRARDDPQVKQIVRVRQLGPEQVENQNRIRRQTQNVNEALNELERSITILKEKVLEEKLGRSPMQAPSLDSIYRAIRNLSAGLQNKIAELDDIALRLDMTTLTTDSPARSKGSTPNRRNFAAITSTSVVDRESPARSPASRSFSHSSSKDLNKTTSRVERNVRRALAAEEFGQKLHEAWLAERTEPLLNTSANKAS